MRWAIHLSRKGQSSVAARAKHHFIVRTRSRMLIPIGNIRAAHNPAKAARLSGDTT
jgi:hypothetical protein